MRRLLPLTLPAALLLGSTGQAQEAPNPLTQPLTVKGTFQNYKPNAVFPVFARSGDADVQVGTINRGGKLELTLTPEQARANRPGSFDGFAQSLKNAGCDVANLESGNTQYTSFSTFTFTTDQGTLSNAVAQTSTTHSDGSVTWKRHLFYYAAGAGFFKARVMCKGEVITYNLALQPGWNVVVNAWTYNAATHTNTAVSYTSVGGPAAYDGSWFAYAR